MANLPSLPQIEGDVGIVIDLYMHRSLQGNSINDDYGDMDRLVQLGAKTLDAVLYAHFFRKRPILVAPQIADEATAAISDAKLRDWLTEYGVHTRYRAVPGSVNLLESPEDMRRFFHGYIGALYYRNGIDHVQAWVSALIDPNAYANALGAHPPPPLTNPPPLPGQGSPPHNTVSGNVLSTLNEAAMRRGFSVGYPAEQTGPAHAPTWSVKCTINGVAKGTGSGKSQKAAKEQAAREALQAMGPGW